MIEEHDERETICDSVVRFNLSLSMMNIYKYK